MGESVSGQLLQQFLSSFAYAKVICSGPVGLWELFYVYFHLNHKIDSIWIMYYLFEVPVASLMNKTMLVSKLLIKHNFQNHIVYLNDSWYFNIILRLDFRKNAFLMFMV